MPCARICAWCARVPRPSGSFARHARVTAAHRTEEVEGQVRELKVRDSENVVLMGEELLRKHRARLGAEERAPQPCGLDCSPLPLPPTQQRAYRPAVLQQGCLVAFTRLPDSLLNASATRAVSARKWFVTER